MLLRVVRYFCDDRFGDQFPLIKLTLASQYSVLHATKLLNTSCPTNAVAYKKGVKQYCTVQFFQVSARQATLRALCAMRVARHRESLTDIRFQAAACMRRQCVSAHMRVSSNPGARQPVVLHWRVGRKATKRQIVLFTSTAHTVEIKLNVLTTSFVWAFRQSCAWSIDRWIVE